MMEETTSNLAADTEPDPRFSLANQRTYLAWVRTAAALIAGGVALHALELQVPSSTSRSISVMLELSGGVLPLLAWREWRATQIALRSRVAIPRPTLLLPVGFLLLVAGTVLALSSI